MSTIEAAARKLAEAEVYRVWAERNMEIAHDEYNKASRACWNAGERVAMALAELTAITHPKVTERTVARPANTAAELLDLDDVGGH